MKTILFLAAMMITLSVSAQLNKQSAIELTQVMPTGLYLATIGSLSADGSFRIFNTVSEVVAIDISIAGFVHAFVQAFHGINGNVADLFIQICKERNDEAAIYYLLQFKHLDYTEV